MSEKLHKTTIALPKDMLEFIDMLVKERYYPNRSTAIRSLIRFGIEYFLEKYPIPKTKN
ncbi:CopG family transcriptional regulator [Thermococci archaeon]|nr:MAG: CopG family transcriptional regulator [Thermococci archaeon]